MKLKRPILLLICSLNLVACRNVHYNSLCKSQVEEKIIASIEKSVAWHKMNDTSDFIVHGGEKGGYGEPIRFCRDFIFPQIENNETCEFICVWGNSMYQSPKGALALIGANLVFFCRQVMNDYDNLKFEDYIAVRKVNLSNVKLKRLLMVLEQLQNVATNTNKRTFFVSDNAKFCFIFKTDTGDYNAVHTDFLPGLDESSFCQAQKHLFGVCKDLLRSSIQDLRKVPPFIRSRTLRP